MENAKDYIKKENEIIPESVQELVEKRNELRKNKRYHLADQVRHKIKKLGYDIQDSHDGSLIIKKT